MGHKLDLLPCLALVSSECAGVWVFCPEVFASYLLYWVSQATWNPIYEGLVVSRPGLKTARPSTEKLSIQSLPWYGVCVSSVALIFLAASAHGV